MHIIQCDSKQEAIQTVAGLVLEKIESHPSLVLGLATGKTMEPVYQELTKLITSSETSLEEAHFFLLDEYLGFPENHPSSFKHYIKKHLIDPLKLKQSLFTFPPVQNEKGADLYEKSIKDRGGIDLQLLGIGQNGHIGFNEPGSMKESRTRIVKLAQETIAANKKQFQDEIIPSKALSMGIGTILEAKNLLMLATGSSKADVIKYLFNNHDDSNCPATFLKGHPHFTLVLDPEAASKINLKI